MTALQVLEAGVIAGQLDDADGPIHGRKTV